MSFRQSVPRPIALFISSLSCAALFSLALHTAPARAQSSPPQHPGQWTAPKNWNYTAIHMALMRGDWGPHRKVHSQLLWWGFSDPNYPFLGKLKAWNPATDDCASSLEQNLTALPVGAPPYNIFCSGHTGLKDGNLLIMGGHENGITGLKNCVIFNREARTWVQTGLMSQRRWYGSATELPDGKVIATSGQQYNHMVMYGGLSSADGTLDGKLERFRLTLAGEWDTPLQGTPPAWPDPRRDHTFVGPADGAKVLFGGVGSNGLARNDAWLLYRQVSGADQTYSWQMATLAAGNPPPPERSLHAAAGRFEPIPVAPNATVTVNEVAMYVFGGLDQNGGALGDLRKVRRDYWGGPWRWINLTGSVSGGPGARYGQTAVYNENLKMAFIFGGKSSNTQFSDDGSILWALAPDDNPSNPPVWRQIQVTGTRPTPRYLHAMTNDPDQRTRLGHGNEKFNRLFFFGGERATGLSNELWSLWINLAGTSAEWEQLNPTGTAPAARRQATLTYHQEDGRLVIFGGDTGGAADPQVWSTSVNVTTPAWSTLAALGYSLAGHAAFFETEPIAANLPEIFDPGNNNQWQPPIADAGKKIPYYPRMFPAPNNKVFWAGPPTTAFNTYLLDLNSASAQRWQLFPSDSSQFDGGPAV